jgi:Flp pilus assembly protein TadG
MSFPVAALRAASQFRRRQHGSMTLEAVLWVPLFLAFFTILADVALMFHGQAMAQRIIQDANRNASSGLLKNRQLVEADILARVRTFSPNARVQTDYGTDYVRSTVAMPARDLVAVGLFTAFANLDIPASAYHRLEIY